MVVENLQDLAKEIVENGISLSAIHYVYITLVALVSAALGAYFGIRIARAGVRAVFPDKNRETVAGVTPIFPAN